MNQAIVDFVRAELLKDLLALPDKNQAFFIVLYRGKASGDDPTIQDVVAALPEDKFDRALSQVQETRKKLDQKTAEAAHPKGGGI